MKLSAFVSVLVVSFLTTTTMAEDCKTPKQALEKLKATLARSGKPTKAAGEVLVVDKKVPEVKFGRIKIANNFDAVDEVKAKCGGTATVFVKSGDDFVRVTTNIIPAGKTERAVGTVLARNKAYELVSKGETFCGEVEILGKPYDTCYEPFKVDGEIAGIYYVGYQK